VHAVKIGIAGEDALAPHLLAGSNAAAAQDAEIVIAIEEGLTQNRHILKRDLISDLFQPHEFHCLLELALPVLGAVLAAYSHRELSHALAQVVAFVFPFAEKAAGRMVGEGQEHLQGMSSHLLQLLCPGLYHHSLFSLGIAGGRIVIQAFYRDDAELARAYGLEVRMVAKRRHIRSGLAGCIQNGRSLGDHNLSIIYSEFNYRHVPTVPGNGGD
jgi:hypothetical protein